jgi:cobaltochelatase CobT
MVAEPASSVPAAISLALAAVFLWVVASIMLRRRGKRPVADAPEGEPYRVYTREYDRTLTVADLPAAVYEASPDREKGHVEVDDEHWRTQIANADAIYRKLGEAFPLSEREYGKLDDTAILLLIDQSGSMRGEPMASVTAGARRLSEELDRCGANVAVAGYTTAGWHGGFARRKWLRDGQPAQPGRLCALLHILYQPFDRRVQDDNIWQQMLNPDILRENVDGEALQWGANCLKERPARRRVLLVISDGAPVDDATLLANGISYLHRHFLTVRDALLDAREPELLAIGVGYRVSEFYPVSREVTDAGGLVRAGLELVRDGVKTG